jgi:hypothetical protein
MSDDSSVKISDSVVIGDVNQSVQTPTCPSCNAMNVIIMSCDNDDCTTGFCEVCTPDCRLDYPRIRRFDSGLGMNPMCKPCLSSTKKNMQRVEREKRRVAKEKRVDLLSEFFNRLGDRFRDLESRKDVLSKGFTILLICVGISISTFGFLTDSEVLTFAQRYVFISLGGVLVIIGLVTWLKLNKQPF